MWLRNLLTSNNVTVTKKNVFCTFLQQIGAFVENLSFRKQYVNVTEGNLLGLANFICLLIQIFCFLKHISILEHKNKSQNNIFEISLYFCKVGKLERHTLY